MSQSTSQQFASSRALNTRGFASRELDVRYFFLSLTCVLIGFGVLMVHSASITSWPTEFEQVYLARHLKYLSIGVVAACIAGCMPARFWMKAAPWLFAGTLLLLGLVLVPGIGTRVNGAARWLRFGPLSMQPSELAKITMPLFVASIVIRRRDSLRNLMRGTVPFALPVGITVGLVVLEPDLGTTLFLLGSASLVLFFGGWPLRNFAVGIVAAICGAGYLILAQAYRVRRITDFVSVWTDFKSSDAWQLKQSLVTLGTGENWGVGLGRGTQKLSFLPESNTDFVFAVVGEELGLGGTLGLAALWCGVFWSGTRLLRNLRSDCFASVVSMTFLTQLVGQALINAAVVTALVPTTGIPHPLVSYGGSSLVVSVVSIGIVVSLSRADAERDMVVLK